MNFQFLFYLVLSLCDSFVKMIWIVLSFKQKDDGKWKRENELYPSDGEKDFRKDDDEPIDETSEDNLKNVGLRLTSSKGRNENGHLELDHPFCEENEHKMTDESFLHHTENSEDELRNLSLRLESDEELPSINTEPSPVFKPRQIVSTLPTFSDEESSDSDHLTKRTRLKLDRLKKTIEQTEKPGRKSDDSGLDSTLSEFQSVKDQLFKKKNHLPRINASKSCLQVKRIATPTSESETDSPAFPAVKKRRVTRGIKSKRRARNSESNESDFGNKSVTDDTWLRKDDTDIQNKPCKRSKTRRKRTFSSGTGGKSENIDHELSSSTSASTTQKGRSRLNSEENKKKVAMQRSMIARKRIENFTSDSDTENYSPERLIGQRKTRTIASILTERRVSLNVTSNNCDFKRWVSNCKQLEERRRTLAKSLSKSSQSAEDVEKSVIAEVFEEGSYSEILSREMVNKIKIQESPPAWPQEAYSVCGVSCPGGGVPLSGDTSVLFLTGVPPSPRKGSGTRDWGAPTPPQKGPVTGVPPAPCERSGSVKT